MSIIEIEGNVIDEKGPKEDTISITSEKELKEPPDGGRAWLVLVGCFCVSKEGGEIDLQKITFFLKGSILHVRIYKHVYRKHDFLNVI